MLVVLYTLQWLYLPAFQGLASTGHSNLIDIGEFVCGRVFSAVTKLILRGNYFAKLNMGLTIYFPNVQFVDISNNMMLYFNNIPALIEILLHNSTVTYNFQYQGLVNGDSMPGNLDNVFDTDVKYYPESTHQCFTSFDKTRKMNCQSSEMTRLIYCINEASLSISPGIANVSTFFSHPLLLEKLASCYFDHDANFSFLKSINIKTIWDTDCKFNVRFPFGENVKIINASNVYFHHDLFTLFHNGDSRLCFQYPNNVTKIDLSGTGFWLQLDTLSPLKEITGLEKLTDFNFRGNIQTINASLFNNNNYPHLVNLDLSQNILLFDENYSFCGKNTNIESINLSGSLMHNMQIPTKLFKGCTELLHANISFNGINNSALPDFELNDTINLQIIDLSYNLIQFLRPTFQNSLAEIAKTHTVHVNLERNPLICNCTNLQFVSWIKYNKSNIYFEHLNNLSCVSPIGIINIEDLSVDLLKKMGKRMS